MSRLGVLYALTDAEVEKLRSVTSSFSFVSVNHLFVYFPYSKIRSIFRRKYKMEKRAVYYGDE